MKSYAYTLLALGVILSFGMLTRAETLISPIRGANPSFGLNRIISPETKELITGETVIKLPESLSRNDVLISSPTIVDANQFMEMLLMSRLAKNSFANTVKVELPPGQELSDLKVIEGHSRILSNDLIRRLLATAQIGHRAEVKDSEYHPPFPLGLIADAGSHSILANELGQLLNLPVLNREQIRDLRGHAINRSALVVAAPTHPYNRRFLEALELVNTLKNLDFDVILLTPYLPYSRFAKADQLGAELSDEVGDEVGDEVSEEPGVQLVNELGKEYSTRLIADLIETAGAKAIHLVHSSTPHIEGFLGLPVIQTSSRETLIKRLSAENAQGIASLTMFSAQDAKAYSKALGIPLSLLEKESVQGKNLVLLFDEFTSPESLVDKAILTRSLGATGVIGVATHLNDRVAKSLENSFFDKIIVTDTFPHVEAGNLTTVKIAKTVARDLVQHVNICEGILTR